MCGYNTANFSWLLPAYQVHVINILVHLRIMTFNFTIDKNRDYICSMSYEDNKKLGMVIHNTFFSCSVRCDSEGYMYADVW